MRVEMAGVYGKMADRIHTYGTDIVIDFFLNRQVWGALETLWGGRAMPAKRVMFRIAPERVRSRGL